MEGTTTKVNIMEIEIAMEEEEGVTREEAREVMKGEMTGTMLGYTIMGEQEKEQTMEVLEDLLGRETSRGGVPTR